MTGKKLKPKAVIFDLDMTLINSVTGIMVSSNLIAKRFGLPEKTYDQVYQAEMTAYPNNWEGIWRTLWGSYDPRWRETYFQEIVEEEYRAMKFFPQARPTLEALTTLAVPLGVASNRDNPRRLLEVMGALHYFRAVVGESDVPRPKPAPDMLYKLLELMAFEPSELIYVGDSSSDLSAAGEVGIPVFGVTSGGYSRERLLELGAALVGELREVIDFFK